MVLYVYYPVPFPCSRTTVHALLAQNNLKSGNKNKHVDSLNSEKKKHKIKQLFASTNCLTE